MVWRCCATHGNVGGSKGSPFLFVSGGFGNDAEGGLIEILAGRSLGGLTFWLAGLLWHARSVACWKTQHNGLIETDAVPNADTRNNSLFFRLDHCYAPFDRDFGLEVQQ